VELLGVRHSKITGNSNISFLEKLIGRVKFICIMKIKLTNTEKEILKHEIQKLVKVLS